jgi:protein required for attachment to host cells
MPPTPSRVARVVVANGSRFMLFDNAGTDRKPSLSLLDEAELPRVAARDLATDRPGRRADVGPGQRSAMEEADPVEEARRAFLRELGATLAAEAQAGRIDSLVVIAPPRALGHLREALGPARGRVAREIEKDLTSRKVPEIETAVGEAFWD